MAVHRGVETHDVKPDITPLIDQPEPDSESERSEILPLVCVLEQQSDSD